MTTEIKPNWVLSDKAATTLSATAEAKPVADFHNMFLAAVAAAVEVAAQPLIVRIIELETKLEDLEKSLEDTIASAVEDAIASLEVEVSAEITTNRLYR